MRIKEKIVGGLVVLLLASTFLPTQIVYAGERWDKLSIGAKSAVGNIIGAVSSNAGNYIKTTNFGVGQRIGGVIDRGGIGIVSRGADSIIGYASKGFGNLIARSGYPGMGGFTILAAKTARRDLPSFERLRGKSEWNKLADGLMEELEGNKRFPNEETIPYRKNSFGAGVYSKMESRVEITRVPTVSDNSSLSDSISTAGKKLREYITDGVHSGVGKVQNATTAISQYIGSGSAKLTLLSFNRPDFSKMFEVNPNPINGPILVNGQPSTLIIRKNSVGVGMDTKMESRTEYAVTNTSTNKTTKMNESIFRNFLNKNNITIPKY